MIVIVFLLIISLLVASGFLIAFIWGSKTGQFDDHFTPANKILFDQTNPVFNPLFNFYLFRESTFWLFHVKEKTTLK